jgi:hypothetical protein
VEVINQEWQTMAQFPTSSNFTGKTGIHNDSQFKSDSEIWRNLKYAISATSGFQRWLLETNFQLEELLLEQQVQMYLRETLETLAY